MPASWIIIFCNDLWNDIYSYTYTFLSFNDWRLITIDYFIFIYFYWLVDIVRHTVSFPSQIPRSGRTSLLQNSLSICKYEKRLVNKKVGCRVGLLPQVFSTRCNDPECSAEIEFLVSGYELSILIFWFDSL